MFKNSCSQAKTAQVSEALIPFRILAASVLLFLSFVGCSDRSNSSTSELTSLQPSGDGSALSKLVAESPHTKFQQITDGTHLTLLAGTVSENRSVPWTKPDDIRFDDTFQSNENAFVEGVFMFANGSVLHINIQDDLDLAKFRSLFTIKAGETNSVGSLYPPGRNFSSFPKTDTVEEALQFAQAAEKSMAISDSLKEIAVAFHNYHAAYQRLPPAIVYGSDGKPWHSWRVLLLPFLQETALYSEYDFSVPWDDPKNEAVLEKIPKVYREPFSADENVTRTRYLVISGEGTAFPTKNLLPPTVASEQAVTESKL